MYGIVGRVCLYNMTAILLVAASILPVPDTLEVTGRVIVANTGFAPVPAFSFDSPIVMAFGSISKKRFLYEPDLSAGFNGKPWMINNWFRYKLVQQQRTTWRIGVNPSLFFKQDQMMSGEGAIHVQRSFVSELAVDRKFTGQWMLSMSYQYVRGIDPGTLKGSFMAATLTTPSLRLYKKLSLNLKPQVIFFDFNHNLGGALFSTTVLTTHERIPVGFYFQGVVPLWLKFESGFKWNFGLVYIF